MTIESEEHTQENNDAQEHVEGQEHMSSSENHPSHHTSSHSSSQHHPLHHGMHKQEQQPWHIWLICIAALLIVFNQWQIIAISAAIGGSSTGAALGLGTASASISVGAPANLDQVDISTIQSTAQAVNALFPLKQIKTADDALKVMVPSGTPSYGKDLGISYDDPVVALNFLATKLYQKIKQDVQTNDPKTWQRYLNLATKPVGISCEYCCGIGPVGITKTGELRCGCSHNPAIQALTLYLMKYTKLSDQEILYEALRWKTLWFPKDMVGIAVKLAGGDTSSLTQVPSMVGGC